jgi:hypothetical protein
LDLLAFNYEEVKIAKLGGPNEEVKIAKLGGPKWHTNGL